MIDSNISNPSNSFRKGKKPIIVGTLNQHRSFRAAENMRDWFHENVGKKKTYKLGICIIQEPYLIKNRLGLFNGLEMMSRSKNGYNVQAWVSFHLAKSTTPLSKSIFEHYNNNIPALELKQQKFLRYPH